MTAPRLLGAVLAGGQSRRFGSDKSAEMIAGKLLVARAAETLADVFADVVIVSSRARATTEWTYVPDLREGQGPLAGIEAALRHAANLGLDGTFVLACDLPLVDADAVRAVVAALGDRAAAAPLREGAPGIEPLCAVYRLACLPVVADALDRGVLATHRIFDSIDGATTELPHEIFLNVNDPGDRERAAVALERGGA